jgi:hypothetical protein
MWIIIVFGVLPAILLNVIAALAIYAARRGRGVAAKHAAKPGRSPPPAVRVVFTVSSVSARRSGPSGNVPAVHTNRVRPS